MIDRERQDQHPLPNYLSRRILPRSIPTGQRQRSWRGGDRGRPRSTTMTVRTSQAKKRASRTGGNPARVKQISKSTAQIVKDAAALLDEEVAEGIVAARQMQQRFRKERRIDANDFNQALQKFQGDAHELITNFNDQLGELRSEENADLMKRLVSNTHDVVDLTVEMVNM